MRKIFLAGFHHETHPWLDGFSDPSAFTVRFGEEIRESQGEDSPLGEVLTFAEQASWTIVPGPLCSGERPGGLVEGLVVESFWRQCFAAWDNRVEAILLGLHGATVAQSIPDVSGELLRRFRQLLPGGAEVPLFAWCASRARVSPLMSEHADAVVAARGDGSGEESRAAIRAAECLHLCLESGRRPKVHRRDTALRIRRETEAEVLAPLRDLAREIEREDRARRLIWSVNVTAAPLDANESEISFHVVARDLNAAGLVLDRLEAKAGEMEGLVPAPADPNER